MKKYLNTSSSSPSMSKPIHIETLDFCRYMARQFRNASSNSSKGLFGTRLFANNAFSKQASDVAMAYETIAKYIEREIKKREKNGYI